MTMADNTIRLTGTPMYCSACRNQDSSVRHVDLDAEVDRGYGDSASSVPISMDDLILCEGCVREAALLIDMVNGEELRHQLEAVQIKLGHEQRRADAADMYAERLELALDARPVAVSAPRRRGRPPKGEHDAGS